MTNKQTPAKYARYKFDIITIGLFILWAIIDLGDFFTPASFYINLSFAFAFVVLLDLSLKQTKNIEGRYKALLKSIYLFSALTIAPVAVAHFSQNSWDVDTLCIANISLPIQSIAYLLFYRKK